MTIKTLTENAKVLHIAIKTEPSNVLEEITGLRQAILTTQEIPRIDSLERMYQLLDVSLVERVEVKLAGEVVTIWCDEESLFKIEPGELYGLTTIKDDDGRKVQLLGKLLFTGDEDEEGNTLDCPLSESDFRDLLSTHIETKAVIGQ